MKIIAVILTVALCSCAPGLGNSFTILQPASPAKVSNLGFYQLQIRPFTDVRPRKTIVTIDGRNLEPKQDLALIAEELFKSMATDAGLRFEQGQGPVLSPRISSWHAIVTPGFPVSNIDAQAIVEIDIFDSTQNLAYRSTYEGSTRYQHPFASEANISWALNDALAHSLNEIFKDQRLASKLDNLGAGIEVTAH